MYSFVDERSIKYEKLLVKNTLGMIIDSAENFELRPNRTLVFPVSLPLLLKSGSNIKKPQFLDLEKVRHPYSSLAGIERTIKILLSLGYADSNDSINPMPMLQPRRRMPTPQALPPAPLAAPPGERPGLGQ
ncbi:hypothetical protein C8255_10760 [filamentous cyanobacterium CCP3]|nr:hypothetical protein C8255_10760 [filamentous cyanobacterium CCP3]